GGADNRFFIYDLQTSSLNRELKLNSRITQIIPSPINPNIALITTAGRSEQFIVFDQRLQGYDGITLKFGQQEGDNLSRYVRPDIHQNGYVVCCGSQSNAKLNFWDLRSRNVIRGGPSFSLDTGMSARILRSVFLPYKNTVVSTSSYRELAWLDYNVKKDEMIQTL
ncbi:hypothetical protein BDF20DRAFT_822098, partial [Mycotypha africana]|uniref:uncharacterized protein n=1 Tax=Mycotypha africana TaxID=64632 RepID=UPI002300FA82